MDYPPQCSVATVFCVQGTNVFHPRSTCLPPVSAESVKIRVKNRDPVPVYQMEMDHRDSDLEGGVVSHHLFTFTSLLVCSYLFSDNALQECKGP